MKNKELKIIFMGTPDFAVGVLSQLVKNQYNIVAVVTVEDKPAGRGKKIMSSPIKDYAITHQIPVLQPSNLKSENFIKELASYKPDLQIVVAFRMLPKLVWSIPKYGTFNLHASLLPSYRGAAPINWAIINGEKETGVTTFFIDEKIDTGAIILQERITIQPDENVGELHDKLMDLGSKLVLKTVDLISEGSVETIIQPKSAISLAPKLYKENCKIDWDNNLDHIYNLIRGLNPFPTAWTTFENERILGEFKIFRARIKKEEQKENIGRIVVDKNEIKIIHKQGFLVIEELQLPNRKKMDAKNLLNGFKFSITARVL